MRNIHTSAAMWPAIRLQVERIIRELIYEHTAPVAEFARKYGHRIPWERRLQLWLSFSMAHPAIGIGHEEFMDVFRDVHGLWPAGRRIMPRRR